MALKMTYINNQNNDVQNLKEDIYLSKQGLVREKHINKQKSQSF